jgi:hypothetical protein
VTGAAVQTAYSADAKAIFVFTNSGHTAKTDFDVPASNADLCYDTQ